ncbi:MAG: RNA polymerase sigma factor [Spirochaetes bacterium]|nr:RNA polymerase sigma factor [Spirochaetota bacterium]
MYNPFYNGVIEDDDTALVREALAGSRPSLEKLVRLHQPWIYNIACRMVADLDEAEDITQEILIKLITRLSTFDPEKSSLRTWLYRVAVNHVISLAKTRHEEPLSALAGDGDYFEAIGKIVDDRRASAPEQRVLDSEAKAACLTGMLLCLDRRSRIAFILGEIFGANDALGAEIMEMERANFRKVLSRARERVYNFLGQKCGLVDANNPCRCSRSVRTQIKLGFIDPGRLITARGSITVSEALGGRVEKIEREYSRSLRSLYRDGPFLEPPDLAGWMKSVLDSAEFRDVFNLQ